MNTVISESDLLYNRIELTSTCLFEASDRLDCKEGVSTKITIIFSLGLILLQLIHISGTTVMYKGNIVPSVEIFLAIVILSYTIICNKSNYGSRSTSLKNAGHQIKELRDQITKKDCDINALSKEYELRLSNIEKYNNDDYKLAELKVKRQRGEKNAQNSYKFWHIFFRMKILTIPCILVFIEFFLISEIKGITTYLFNYLQ